jgi:hypothetical protein
MDCLNIRRINFYSDYRCLCVVIIHGREEFAYLYCNILSIIVLDSFVISKFTVRDQLALASLNINRECIIISRESFLNSSTRIVALKVTVVNNDNFIIVFIGTKFFLAMVDMDCSLNFWPVNNHSCSLSAII